MRLALCQLACRPGEVAGNLARARELVAEAAARGAELACLPELCLSGYLLARADYTDGLLDAVEAALDELQALGPRVVVGAPERDGVALRNTVFLLEPDGSRRVYRKVHMDYKERAVFERGSGFPADGGDVGLGCCYDVAFPEAARLLALAGARLLVFPMAWEKRRAYVMEQTAAARAIENVCYVACVNQTGDVGGFEFHGRTTLLDPLGQPVVRLGEEEGVALVDVDLERIDALRTSPDGDAYPLFADRRPELYEALR